MDRRKKGGFRTTLFASCWTPGWPAELTKRSRFPYFRASLDKITRLPLINCVPNGSYGPKATTQAFRASSRL